MNTPEVGDFIRDNLRRFTCGFVVAVGSVPVGKRGQMPAYTVRLASGATTTIYGPNADLVAYSDEREARLRAEVA